MGWYISIFSSFYNWLTLLDLLSLRWCCLFSATNPSLQVTFKQLLPPVAALSVPKLDSFYSWTLVQTALFLPSFLIQPECHSFLPIQPLFSFNTTRPLAALLQWYSLHRFRLKCLILADFAVHPSRQYSKLDNLLPVWSEQYQVGACLLQVRDWLWSGWRSVLSRCWN